MTQPNEDAIRDALAKRLDHIEPGLILVDREYYLKNSKGASGFIDIFARDAQGRFVVIEIKRTDGAAREAIQELYKYIALLRENRLVRDIDYRVIVLAVKWHELLVPYSEFAKSAPFEVTAGRIVLGEDGLPVHVEHVEPVPTAEQRRFSPRHFLWRFEDEATALGATQKIAKHMQNAGLIDFVLVRSKSANPALAGKSFLYFAQQQLSLDAYLGLIHMQNTGADFDDFALHLSDLVELEDKIAEASDAVWLKSYDDLYGRINSDHSEISHPAKAGQWFASGAQRDVVVQRFGRFVDPDLPDETIIAELIGLGGASDFHLRLRTDTRSAPQIVAMREAISNIFYFNAEWRGTTLDLLAYAEKTGPATVEIIAFSNEDVLRAIAGAAFNYPGFVPAYRFTIDRPGAVQEVFLGLIEWDNTPFDFDRIIAEHLDGAPFSYFLATHFGENRGMNADIMADLGLHYITLRQTEEGLEKIRVLGASVAPTTRKVGRGIFGVVQPNKDEVHKIVEIFMDHDQGFRIAIDKWINDDFNVAERELASRISGLTPPEEPGYWNGRPKACNLCERDFNTAQLMVDAHVRGGGANICALCYLIEQPPYGTLFASTPEGWQMLGSELRDKS